MFGDGLIEENDVNVMMKFRRRGFEWTICKWHGTDDKRKEAVAGNAGRTRVGAEQRFGSMSEKAASQKPVERREGNKATMDQPQEEFIADQSVPSHRMSDRDHGHEVEKANAPAEGAG
jgi:hypothetical protein